MMELVRNCPGCESERPTSEMRCSLCNWPLSGIAPVLKKSSLQSAPSDTPPEKIADDSSRQCLNGHRVAEGEFLCLECGADIPDVPNPATDSCAPSLINECIEGWTIREAIVSTGKYRDCFRVENETGEVGYLMLFHEQHEPDSAIYDVLRATYHDHIPVVLLTGRWRQRAFAVIEWIKGGSLQERAYFPADDLTSFRNIADELGRALRDLAEMGVRHRNICPRSILIRSEAPLDLVITDFSSARLSDFDLDTVAPLDISRYSAPEAIVGGVSAASDWWGLGMILLEQATAGACFEGINEQAFRIHVVTRGIEIPDNIPAALRPLLQGLLARDPLQRWQWEEVRRWLNNEPVNVPEEHRRTSSANTHEHLIINDIAYADPESLALALATETHWPAGLEHFESGRLTTWLQHHYGETLLPGKILRLSSQSSIPASWRFSLALMELNPALPLVNQGVLITPAWLLDNPADGFSLITGDLPAYLETIERESWLVNLHYRYLQVLERAALLDIEIDHVRLKITALATSRANLEAERHRLRELYPSSNHDALANLMEKARLNEEDLVLLLCAKVDQFTPFEMVVSECLSLTDKYDIAVLDRHEIDNLVILPKRDLYQKLDERIANFARCGHATLDTWADDYRIQRRITLPRAIALLSLAESQWTTPPKQHYVANILHFFEKRVANSVMRGPLIRLTIAKTSARIDMTELHSGLKPATALIEHILCRNNIPTPVDPQVFQQNPLLERRLWRLVQAATNNRRDTGIDTLYMGFPFLIIGDQKIRPRVAPVFLWPVNMGFTLGASAKLTLNYDSDRMEIRLNPALEGLVGQTHIKRWQQLHTELLERNKLSINDVIDTVSALVPAHQRGLQSHLATATKVEENVFYCHGSAVIFNAQFSGQAITEDLRQLQGLPIKDTALESLLRVAEPESRYDTRMEEPLEVDRYNVVLADPSQDKAVLQGRAAPGVVIEGPPGTGKSQTIVNIIADCIGRNEKVLVVCQKQAALRVVEKRLEAVHLHHRLLTITDINKDRPLVIRAVRDQVPEVLNADTASIQRIKQTRIQVSSRIDQLERELNARHSIINQHDELSGLSYRQIICALIEVDTRENLFVQPTLRRLLGHESEAAISKVEEQCASLAADWLPSHFENSTLDCFTVFNVDAEILASIKQLLDAYVSAEQHRITTINKTLPGHDHKDLTELFTWAEANLNRLKSLDDRQLQLFPSLFDIFYDEVNQSSEGEDLLTKLKEYYNGLTALNPDHHDDRFFAHLQSCKPNTLNKYLSYCESLTQPVSGIGKFNPFRYFRKRKIRSLLNQSNESYSSDNILALRDALALEITLGTLRKKIDNILRVLSIAITAPEKQTLKYMVRTIYPLIDHARKMVELCKAIRRCPLNSEAKIALKSGSRESIAQFSHAYQDVISRFESRNVSLAALENLKPWFTAQWYEHAVNAIANNERDIKSSHAIVEELDNLPNYQRFRLRASTVDALTLCALKELRKIDHALKPIAPTQLSSCIRAGIRREALLGWKLRIEEKIPSLLMGNAELRDKVQHLDALDQQKTNTNQLLLIHDIAKESLANNTRWSDITKLRGQRYKKLREFLDLGRDLGLMELRPIWMMSPEAVSQALPRLSGMFDVVIFDEASQMTVDFAIPALYRAKRVIISGDEKQMPPSNFFSGNIDVDEEDSIEELDEDASEAEIAQHEDIWNRREIKDCPDLLMLGKSILPTKTLEIHYRSAYRSLIDFSNYAYYSWKLHVPAIHPDTTIIKEKPIEVHMVNGTYINQENADEARKVVELVAAIWKEFSEENRPSLGVVTFNKKQAELIEDTLQEYAETSPEFYQAYLCEQSRQQHGEDMGFFVKNVENVQGDERDIILFSTTFGLNEHGAFRRNFGALGHKGGERRLNVAITRARKKVIIATSMPLRDISDMLATGRQPIKPRDFIQAYLEYAGKISLGEIQNAKEKLARLTSTTTKSRLTEHTDGFIKSVEAYICSLGYFPQRGSSDDAFNVDLALVDPRTGQYGLGIECDAPVNTLLHNTRTRDIWRPKILERSIPVLHRINCYDWYQDKENEKMKLVEIITTAVG